MQYETCKIGTTKNRIVGKQENLILQRSESCLVHYFLSIGAWVTCINIYICVFPTMGSRLVIGQPGHVLSGGLGCSSWEGFRVKL